LISTGIPTIVLKGWALIPTVYQGDYGQRTFADIDLLVPPEDVERASQILRELGYCTLPEPWPGFVRRYGNNQSFQRPSDPGPFGQVFAIGLHWGLLDTPYYFKRVSVEALFERAHPLHVAGIHVSALSPEDHLVYSCGHQALHHGYSKALFRNYENASIVLKAGQALKWNAVIANASAWRLVLPVSHIFDRLETLWPGLIPTQVLQEISRLHPTLSERMVHRCVVDQKDNHTVRAALAWLTMPGLGRRWRFLLETSFPSPTYMHQRYGPAPRYLWPLLYLRRVAAAAKHIS
jgi:hypothetical protein